MCVRMQIFTAAEFPLMLRHAQIVCDLWLANVFKTSIWVFGLAGIDWAFAGCAAQLIGRLSFPIYSAAASAEYLQ